MKWNIAPGKVAVISQCVGGFKGPLGDKENITQGEVKCYICHEILTKSCRLSYKQKFKCFMLKNVLTEDIIEI